MTKNVPEAALALWLADRAATQGDLMFIARGETQLERLYRACEGFAAGRAEVLALPGWDVLPYDRAAPSPGIVGRRVRTLLALGRKGALPRLLLTSPGAAMQLVPAAAAWNGACLRLGVGDAVDAEALRHALVHQGYHPDEAVADKGEIAMRGQVIDLFPADAERPVRLLVEEGRVTAIHAFDPVSQRSLDELEAVELVPASEFPLSEEAEARALEEGEAPPPEPEGRLVPVFDSVKGFAVALDAGVGPHWQEGWDAAEDAYRAWRQRLRAAEGRRSLPPPGKLFLTAERVVARCGEVVEPAPEGEAEGDSRSVAELVRRAGAHAGAVVIAAPGDPARLARSLARRGVEARAAGIWAEAAAGGVACVAMEVGGGFRRGDLLVLNAAPLLKVSAPQEDVLRGADDAPRAGDVVVHEEHGAARLVGLKAVEDGAGERVALAFQGGGELLVDPFELDRIWRYGTEGSIDRMDGEAWRAKRDEVEGEIAVVAGRLAEAAEARRTAKAAVFEPDAAAFARLARRFPHPLSTDQASATEAVLADLRAGHPMDRLVCGDVGFGKTEVALRAAAAVALAGGQVAVAAPTTVLARQHLETFRRRFAGSGVRVEAMIGPPSAELRAELASGAVGIVVGTQGLARPGLRFKALGLVVVDEEQRFGEGQKQALGQAGVHRLALTATPIPRTMQMAMVGLRDVSVIATAPQRRQPTRTLVLPLADDVLREALLREHGRGGQSFVVVPRIADMEGAAERVARLAPGLGVSVAHGRMRAEALEAAVLGFAAGEADVLLATNIIEAGLDIPGANTIVVMQPDRFGLAQLHQMRGRVGRGTRRGTAYLLTQPGRRLAKPTAARLKAMQALGSLGAGFAISAADLDQRGAGELFGETQAGHVTALGTELYHHLLLRAVQARRGEASPPPAPALQAGLTGCIPAAYVPEEDLRIALYRRLARMGAPGEVEAFAAELEDRFGALPAETEALLALGRLRCAMQGVGARLVQAGPKGAAIELHDAGQGAALAKRLGGEEKGERVLLRVAGSGVGQVEALTAAVSGAAP